VGDPTAVRPMRADARRNRDRLLAEARVAFLEHGTETSLEQIAGRAGVGIGTLYRHFPTREALLEALLRERFDALAADARTLLGHRSPREALFGWTRNFAESSTTYRGLTNALMTTLRDESSALHASCNSVREAGLELLVRAQNSGEIRNDLDGTEFLTLVFGVACAHEQVPNTAIDRLLAMLFDGLSGRGRRRPSGQDRDHHTLITS
jgi:AcrR family transcriptional regulator